MNETNLQALKIPTMELITRTVCASSYSQTNRAFNNYTQMVIGGTPCVELNCRYTDSLKAHVLMSHIINNSSLPLEKSTTKKNFDQFKS